MGAPGCSKLGVQGAVGVLVMVLFKFTLLPLWVPTPTVPLRSHPQVRVLEQRSHAGSENLGPECQEGARVITPGPYSKEDRLWNQGKRLQVVPPEPEYLTARLLHSQPL